MGSNIIKIYKQNLFGLSYYHEYTECVGEYLAPCLLDPQSHINKTWHKHGKELLNK